MAKIGNEAALLLKLAKERSETRIATFELNLKLHPKETGLDTEIAQKFIDHYKRATQDYTNSLAEIIRELENR